MGQTGFVTPFQMEPFKLARENVSFSFRELLNLKTAFCSPAIFFLSGATEQTRFKALNPTGKLLFRGLCTEYQDFRTFRSDFRDFRTDFRDFKDDINSFRPDFKAFRSGFIDFRPDFRDFRSDFKVFRPDSRDFTY